MIVYDHNTWLGSLTRIRGTVISSILGPVICVALWACIVLLIATGPYPGICELSADVTATHKMLGTFVSFFLIFRTNQAYIRYWQCNETLKLIQIGTRELHSQFLIYMKGGHVAKGKDEAAYQKMERTALQAKVDATRYIMSYCVAFKLHSRIAYDGYNEGEIDLEKKAQVDFDRARLRGLLTAEEFAIVDNILLISDEPLRGGQGYPVSKEVACRACHIIIFFLRSLCGRVSVASGKWGWFERCLNLCDGGIAVLMRAFEEMDQNITTPLPLPYCHLCKWLMGLYLFFYPIACSLPSQGMLVNVFTTIVIAIAMFGIEAISMEIEDPFGDDDNDFDVMRIISAIEDSIYEAMVLKGGDEISFFSWIQAPPDYRQCNRFLCLHSEAGAVLQRMPTACLEKYSVNQSPTRQALHAIGGMMWGEHDQSFNTSHRWVRLTTNAGGQEKRDPMGLAANGELCAWRPT